MSDEKLNDLEIKKILEAQKLLKSGMSVQDMKQVYDLFKCKQIIEAEGLYENGMTDDDIKAIYNTLKKSQETAGSDNEYRKIMNSTESNCSNISMLIDESNTTNEETVDVTSSTQAASPKRPTVSKSFSSLIKKHGDKQSIKNINVLMEVENNNQFLKSRNVKYSNASVLYYHQTKIMKLPLTERAIAISQYLLNIQKYYQRDFNMNKWSNPIQPQQNKQFNGDLCVDFIADIPEEDESIDSPTKVETESPVKDNYLSTTTRPKRLIKRKNYVDLLSDDEDDSKLSKKTKSNDDLNSSSENIDTSTGTKWIKRKRKPNPNTPLYFMAGSDRVNKIFDKLKWDDKPSPSTQKKNLPQYLQETMNLSDSDEEIFPAKELVTTVNVHKEEDQTVKSKNCKTTKAKKTSPKKRAVYNKLSLQKNSATKENESPEITTLNFYGKNKNSEVEESNNNKSEKSEDSTNCPICNGIFSLSTIEAHASNCTQYEGKEAQTSCEICNEIIPEKKIQSHKYECLKKITEASIVVDKPVTRYAKNQRTNGFLCQVCDKYICNTSEILHASNCIAKV